MAIKVPTSRRWTFWTSADDTASLYIDDQFVCGNTEPGFGNVKKTGSIDLTGGVHKVEAEFTEIGGTANLKVFWDLVEQGKEANIDPLYLCFDRGAPGVHMTRCTVQENSAGLGGGGICCRGREPIGFTSDADTFTGNSAPRGGGVFCRGGSADLRRAKMVENRSALWFDEGALLKLTNSLVAGGQDIGIRCEAGTLTNCTIAKNPDGGIACNGPPNLVNCIFWDNGRNDVCGTLDHSLTVQDPLFVDIEALDFHLSPGSPAINRGTSVGGLSTDLDGEIRPCCEGCEKFDIGAYEYCCACPGPLFVRGLVQGAKDRQTPNITDAIVLLNYLFRGGSEPPCLGAADINDDGANNITDVIYLLGHLFLGGPAPQAPFPMCGVDRIPDSLSCRISTPLCL